MDFSKLNQNEKLAVYGAAAVIIGGVVGYSYGVTAFGILLAIVMLVIVFLPQLSPGTNLPGSRGSLMVAVGGLAGATMLLALVTAVMGVLFINTNFRDIFFLVAVAGGLVMGWAGWREFQSEGGRFQLGTSGAAPSAPPPAAPAAPVASAEPVVAADVPPAAPVVAAEPVAVAEPVAAPEPRPAEPSVAPEPTMGGEPAATDAPAVADDEDRPAGA